LAASAVPLWKKFIQPRLAAMRKQRAGGRYGKRDEPDFVDEEDVNEMVNELLADEEFLEYLANSLEDIE
jgi:hypothetical protein